MAGDPPQILLLTLGEYEGDTICRFIKHNSNGKSIDINSVTIETDGIRVSSAVNSAREKIGTKEYDAVAVVCRLPQRATSESQKFFSIIRALIHPEAFKTNGIVLFTNWEAVHNFDLYLQTEIKKNAKDKYSLGALANDASQHIRFNAQEADSVAEFLDVIADFRPVVMVTDQAKGLVMTVLIFLVLALILGILLLKYKPSGGVPFEVPTFDQQSFYDCEELTKLKTQITDVKIATAKLQYENEIMANKRHTSMIQHKLIDNKIANETNRLRKLLKKLEISDVFKNLKDNRFTSELNEVIKMDADTVKVPVPNSGYVFRMSSFLYMMHIYTVPKPTKATCPKKPDKFISKNKNRLLDLGENLKGVKRDHEELKADLEMDKLRIEEKQKRFAIQNDLMIYLKDEVKRAVDDV